MNKKILFRCDGGGNIGFGHLMRCKALSEIFIQNNYRPVFAMKQLENTPNFIERKDILIKFMPNTISLNEESDFLVNVINNINPFFTVLDNYEINLEYFQKIRNVSKTLVIDDIADRNISADVLLNYNFCANEISYNINKDAEVLTGPKYSLIRNEILEKAKLKKTTTKPQNVLITGGGSDPSGLIRKIINLLVKSNSIPVKNLNYYVVLSPSFENSYKDEIKYLTSQSNLKFTIVENKLNLTDLFLKCDMIISPGSSICYEASLFGLPIIAIECEQNQKFITQGVSKVNCGFSMNFAGIDDKLLQFIQLLTEQNDVFERIVINQKKIVDGLGKNRIYDFLDKKYNNC